MLRFPQLQHVRAAWFLSVLAHPEDTAAAERKRIEAVTALLAWAAKLVKDERREVQIPKALSEYPSGKIHRSGPAPNAIRRIGARLEAAAVAEAMLPVKLKLSGEQGGVLVDGAMVPVRTVKEAARAVIDARVEWRRGETNVQGFLHNTWKPSWPVLPLAIAFHRLLHEKPGYLVADQPGLPELAKPGSVDFIALLLKPDWVEPTIRNAVQIKRILPSDWQAPLGDRILGGEVTKIAHLLM